MKSFTERVKCHQEKHEGMHVFRVYRDMVSPKLIDLIAMKNGKVTFIFARGNGHGNLNSMTKLRLQRLGMQCGAKVLHAKIPVSPLPSLLFDVRLALLVREKWGLAPPTP